MSQSTFTKYQDRASSKVRDNAVPTRTGQSDERNSLRCSTSDAIEKGDSDLQMHPLFQDPKDGNSLLYYPFQGSAGSSSSFDFFLELTSLSMGVNFHPLLQTLDDGIISHPPASSSTPPRTDVSAMPHGQSGREFRTIET
ncbi:homeodomain-like superfamily protein [Tanacetum coccineum]